jgi:hypothetical protein
LRPAAREAAQRVVRDVVRAWPQECVVAWVEWHISLDEWRGFAWIAGNGVSQTCCFDEDGSLGNHSPLDWMAGRLVDLDSALLPPQA